MGKALGTRLRGNPIWYGKGMNIIIKGCSLLGRTECLCMLHVEHPTHFSSVSWKILVDVTFSNYGNSLPIPSTVFLAKNGLGLESS